MTNDQRAMTKDLLGLVPTLVLGAAAMLVTASPSGARSVAGKRGSANVHVTSHIPFAASDIEIEQELARPYAYVSTWTKGGFEVVSLKDPQKASVIYSWQIENP